MDVAEVVGMWAFMASWFTPTILFCVLNLMIGTIFISSNYKTPNKPPPPPAGAEDGQYNPPQLARASSIADRFRSLNFSLYRSEQPETHYVDPPHHEQQQEQQQHPEDEEEEEEEEVEDEHNHPPQLTRAPSLLGRVSSFDFSFFRSERPDPPREEDPRQSRDHPVKRMKSDTTGEGPPPAKLAPARMRRSVSEKLGKEEAEEDTEEIDRRRPATVRERNTTAMYVEDEEVDAKADDFINKFKKQLKLQRLDSVIRFSEMLNRGT